MSNHKIHVLAVAALCTVLIYFSLPNLLSAGPVIWRPPQPNARNAAANATIGFEAILALSSGQSWRTKGLAAAAALTGIDILVPDQPPIGEEMIQFFQNFSLPGSKEPIPAHGSAKAWLAHLDLLKFVVASAYSTSLILEDDADWDVMLREQMRLVSDNVRRFTYVEEDNETPFGTSWDVLWLGHCGEVPGAVSGMLQYPDETLMPKREYAGWSKKYLVDIQEGHRAVQYLRQAVCTFAYGVTSSGARRILEILSSGQDEAFDVGLMNKCRQGLLKCITVNPELFHHYSPQEGTNYVSETKQGDGKGVSSQDQKAFERLKGTTANIRSSARCAALFQDTCPQPPT